MDKPFDQQPPVCWPRRLEEQAWLTEMADALRPFIDFADSIPPRGGDKDLDTVVSCSHLTKGQWWALRRVVTGVGYGPGEGFGT